MCPCAGIADSGALLCLAVYGNVEIRCYDSVSYALVAAVSGRQGWQNRGIAFTNDGAVLASAYMGASVACGGCGESDGAVVLLRCVTSLVHVHACA